MAKMRVGIDISAMNKMSKKRGIGFYATYLYESLKKYSDLDVVLIGNKDQSEFDIIHYPFFDFFSCTLPFFKKRPTVVTIHDVTPLIFPDHYPAGIRGRVNLFIQKQSLKSATSVITDSTVSKNDVGRFLPVKKEKIYVTYLAQADRFRVINDYRKLSVFRNKRNLPEKFALYVGNINWNKNLLGMAKSAINSKITLVFVGGGFNTNDNLEHKELESFNIFKALYSNSEYIKILGFLNDEEVVEIMNLATVLLLPSFYEGFGLTILEAQACGTAVITSTTSSMPEVAGNGAVMVNPYKADEISAGLQKVFYDNKYRNDLIKKGFINIKRFSWKKCAEETSKIYEKTLLENP